MNNQRYGEQPEQQKQDMSRVWAALDDLERFKTKYGDLVVFPEVITLLDVADAEMPVQTGPTHAKDIFTREELLAALQVLKASPCANVSEAIYYAVLDYRQTKNTTKE